MSMLNNYNMKSAQLISKLNDIHTNIYSTHTAFDTNQNYSTFKKDLSSLGNYNLIFFSH